MSEILRPSWLVLNFSKLVNGDNTKVDIKFNSSMEPDNVCEFYMCIALVVWCKTQRIYKTFLSVFIPQCQNFNYNMPLPRCSCKWLLTIVSFLSMNATMTKPFVTFVQVKLICFNALQYSVFYCDVIFNKPVQSIIIIL